MELLKIALSQYGVKEESGDGDNPAIVQYAKEDGFSWVDHDSTPWCSIFMNWVAKEAKYERTRLANARSWLDVGEEVKVPETGDIVVLSRGSSTWQGHVGIYINSDEDFVYVLGGNQSDSVNISPYNKKRVLGYRRLKREG